MILPSGSETSCDRIGCRPGGQHGRKSLQKETIKSSVEL
jgi:hypothetical protein